MVTPGLVMEAHTALVTDSGKLMNFCHGFRVSNTLSAPLYEAPSGLDLQNLVFSNPKNSIAKYDLIERLVPDLPGTHRMGSEES